MLTHKLNFKVIYVKFLHHACAATCKSNGETLCFQGVIHWVARPSPGVEPLKVEVRHYDKLFKSEVCEASLSGNGHESYDFWSGVGCFELVAKRMLAEVVQLLREKLNKALAIW